ncbi:cytochrome P450 [Nonomuraea sp. NPDC005983]|uniref:cytochrome P450 family protein n=1 Tax=Nonomuraea sp. NPDC005983 TaxID=3155595 RepID=UPI0033A7FDF0
MIELDLWSEAFAADPYPVYARMREEAPAHRISGPMGIETWLVTRYDEARAALNDPLLSKNPVHAPSWMRELGIIDQAGEGPVGVNMLSSDPPDHARLRKLVTKAFTRRRMDGLRPRIQEITDSLIDAMAARKESDLIAELAFPLPIIVICELLGIPKEDRDDFRAWSTALTTPPLTPEGIEVMKQGRQHIQDYLAGFVARTRQDVDLSIAVDDQPNLVSALIAATDEHGRLSERELLGTLNLLLVAGHETTVNLIGNGVLALLTHPDQRELLRARPELLPSAVEELLRYDGPVARATPRFATADVEIGGVTIPAGSVVSVVLGAANRDPAHTQDADKLDVTRTDHGNVAFGHGIHYCLGAPLARIEGEIAIGTLLRRHPDLALSVAPDDLRWRGGGPANVFRGLETLPVRRP